jgi:hypothetical protein
MKNKFFISLSIMLMTMITLVISCSDLQEEDVINTEHLKSMKLNGSILEEQTLLGDNIYLPKGTNWYYSNEQKNEVIFKLPEDYIFMLKNVETGKFSLSIEGGGYSCTCSSGGSCTTFYNKDLGYGCLQSDCTGSCTGKASAVLTPNLQIVGVLNAKNTMLDANLLQEKASLSSEGIDGFFEIEEIKEEIKRTYDIIYKYAEKPNFESGYDISKYVYAKTLLYGFEVGIIIPNDAELQKSMKNLNVSIISDVDAPSSCKCSGGSQGGSCKLEKKGLFGYVAYYCNGCSTCTMN